jgi:glycosyltransferase involved in cell wall biosynthesis
MNILYLYRGTVTQDSGAGIHVREVVRNLALNHRILLVADHGDPFDQEGIRIISMNIPKKKGFVYVFTMPYLLFYLLKTVSRNDIDLIYCRELFSCLCVIILNKIKKIPFVFEVNGILSDESKLRESYKFYVFSARILEYIVFNLSDTFICVTEEIKNVIEKKYKKKKVYFVPNGADTDLFTPVKNAHTRLGFDKSFSYVGYVGSFAPWQGVEILIKAAAEVVKTFPTVRVLLVGSDKKMNRILTLVSSLDLEDTIIFAGRVPHADVPLYLSVCDICVSPKRPLVSGYSPLKLYEYMACENPVIASRIKGFDIVETAHAGILVEPENPHDLAKAIVHLLGADDLKEEMGKNGRAYVIQNHSWKKVSNMIEEICLETRESSRQDKSIVGEDSSILL